MKIKSIFVFFTCASVISTLIWAIANRDTVGGLLWLALSIICLWMVKVLFEKIQFSNKSFELVVVSLCMISIVPLPFWVDNIIYKLNAVTEEARYDRIKVTNFNDEILYSEFNNPLGIRVTYDVVANKNDLSEQDIREPMLADEQLQSRFYIMRFTIDKKLENDSFPDINFYNITADFIPKFIFINNENKGKCTRFYKGEKEFLLKTKLQKISITVPETDSDWRNIHYLRNNYNYNYFYDTINKENYLKCNNSV